MRTIIISAIIALSIVGYGFIGFESGENNPDDTNSMNSADKTVTGQALFLSNCAVCHQTDRSGMPPAFPALTNISEKMTKEEIAMLLKTGRKAMPSFANLSDEERQAITGFLFGEETVSKTVTELTPVEKGASLFTANCTSCHKAKPDDPEPTGRKNMGRTPIVLGGVNKIHTLDGFERILNQGPCYMPSFENLQSEDKKAIYLWLSTIDNPQSVNTSPMGGCRMGGHCMNR